MPRRKALRTSRELPAHPLALRVHELTVHLEHMTGEVIGETARIVARELQCHAHEQVLLKRRRAAVQPWHFPR